MHFRRNGMLGFQHFTSFLLCGAQRTPRFFTNLRVGFGKIHGIPINALGNPEPAKGLRGYHRHKGVDRRTPKSMCDIGQAFWILAIVEM